MQLHIVHHIVIAKNMTLYKFSISIFHKENCCVGLFCLQFIYLLEMLADEPHRQPTRRMSHLLTDFSLLTFLWIIQLTLQDIKLSQEIMQKYVFGCAPKAWHKYIQKFLEKKLMGTMSFTEPFSTSSSIVYKFKFLSRLSKVFLKVKWMEGGFLAPTTSEKGLKNWRPRQVPTALFPER